MQEGRSEDQLAARVALALRLPAVALVPQPAGTSRGAYRVDTIDGKQVAFLRTQLGEQGAASVGLDLVGEATLVQRIHAFGFPVPEVFAIFENPPAAVMEFARGTPRPSAAEVELVGAEYMSHIARLHSLDPAALQMNPPPTIRDAIRQDLAGMVATAQARGVMRSPVVRLAIRVLRETAPASEAKPVMLHGDVGAGNFLVHDGRVSAILDWELAHVGDFHEDLAWLWIRGAHTDFGDPATRVAEYERAAGHAVDRDRLAWHIAFVTFKSIVGLQSRMMASDEDPGVLMIWIAVLAYEALLCAALARLVGTTVALLDEEPETRSNPIVRLADRLTTTAALTDREQQIILRHLRDSAALASWEAERLHADAQRELRIHPDQLESLIDSAEPRLFEPLVRVLGAAAGRRCQTLPNAERRVRRALSIGYGQ